MNVGDIITLKARDTVRFEGKSIADAKKVVPCTFLTYGKVIAIKKNYAIICSFETDDPEDENNDGYAIPLETILKKDVMQVFVHEG